MRKFTIIILLALTLTGCNSPGRSNDYYEGYDEGYEKGYKDGINEPNTLSVGEMYDIDDIEEYLEDNGYVIITQDDYMKYIETADY